MTERTKQEIFDIAYKGLAAQGFVQSRLPSENGCAYRGNDGLKCAVGHLIPDEKYRMEMEGISAFSPEITSAAGIDDRDHRFADELQQAHDGEYGAPDRPELMVERLADFAAANGLTIPQVTA